MVHNMHFKYKDLKRKIISQMLLESPESFMPHDDFVAIILKCTVCCSHCLKAPQNSFLINGYRAKKNKKKNI